MFTTLSNVTCFCCFYCKQPYDEPRVTTRTWSSSNYCSSISSLALLKENRFTRRCQVDEWQSGYILRCFILQIDSPANVKDWKFMQKKNIHEMKQMEKSNGY